MTISLDQPREGDRLTAGQTISVRASVGASQAVAGVLFTVNGALLATDTTPPYEMTFTVPVGVDRLTFAASVTDADGDAVAAAPVAVSVDPDSRTTIGGRVVHASGLPVRGAVVELLSRGVQADFFRFLAAPRGSLSDVTGRTPDSSTRVTAINQRNPGFVFGADPFGTGLAPDYVGRFTGWITTTTAGVHRFIVGAGEGVRLKVGGVTLVDVPTGSGVYQETSGSINLSPGLIPVEMNFYSSQGSGELQLSFVPPNGERAIVAPSLLVADASSFTVTTDESGLFMFAGVPTALDGVQIRATVTSSGQTISTASDVSTPVSKDDIVLGDIVIPIQQ